MINKNCSNHHLLNSVSAGQRSVAHIAITYYQYTSRILLPAISHTPLCQLINSQLQLIEITYSLGCKHASCTLSPPPVHAPLPWSSSASPFPENKSWIVPQPMRMSQTMYKSTWSQNPWHQPTSTCSILWKFTQQYKSSIYLWYI